MSWIRHAVFLFCMAAMSAPVLAAPAATNFPTRAIELVIPYPAGGPNDVIGRILGEQMGKELGQSIVVRNMPGAGGNVATASVARAKADGYTLLLPAMAYAVNPFIFKEVNYTFQDFQPVSMVVQGPLVLVVHPSLNITTTQQFIDAAKAEPGKLEYASGGIGSSLHLAAELFKKDAGIDVLHVPYKGTGELIPDLLAGRVGALFSSPLTVRPQVDEGKLVALGVTDTKPMRGWDGIPPLSDTVPGFEMFAWYSLMAPAGVPADVIQKLNAAVQAAQQSPEFKEKMNTLGMETMTTTPEQAQSYIDGEIDKWRDLIKEAGITTN